jgi:hypothetical protein
MNNIPAIGLRRFVTATIFTTSALLSAPIVADWTINDGVEGVPTGEAQDIVITLKQNPRSNPEATCLAITLARSLRGDFSPPDAPPTGANVTLFPTLDGVAIGRARVVSTPRFRCTTPEGLISLEENLEDFLCDSGDRDVCIDFNMDNLVQQRDGAISRPSG